MSADTPTLAEVMRSAIEAAMVNCHVALPAKVESYDASEQSVDVKPLIKREIRDENDERLVESLPVITRVPVVFPGGGGYRVTFPIAKGDTVLLVFSEASMDKWLDSKPGQDVDPLDTRRNTLSDAIAIPGLRQYSNALSDAPTSFMSAGLDGGPVIEFDEAEIRGGGSGAESLAFGDHFHLDSNGQPTTAPLTSTIPNPSYNPTLPDSPANQEFLPGASDPGTVILKGK